MGDSIINMTRGVPPANAFPTEDLIRCAEIALRSDPATLLQYGKAPGYGPLREWLAQENNTSTEQVLLGNSSLEVFSFISHTMMQPGQRAFVESPSYDRAIALLRRAEADVVGIPLEEDGLSIETLEREIALGAPALVYIVADFQNPMGTTTSLEKRRRLADLSREHDFWIAEDAPYRTLRYKGQDVPTLMSLAPERVLHMSSFSKILAPGLRLGYVIGPTEAVAKVSSWATDSYIGPVYPTQGMVYEYCRQGLLERNIERLKQLYRPRLEAALSALETHLPRATWTHPEGGFFIGVTLPPEISIQDLVQRAPDVGLKLSDGRNFYPVPDEGEHFLRIPFCSVTPEDLVAGVERLATIM